MAVKRYLKNRYNYDLFIIILFFLRLTGFLIYFFFELLIISLTLMLVHSY